jgi:uncharacterized protein YodC (DUF2158 family)
VGGVCGGYFELEKGDCKVGCVIELMQSGGFYWAGFWFRSDGSDYNPLIKTGNLLEGSQAVVDLVSGGKNMKKQVLSQKTVTAQEETPKFKRGDKVRDIYGGPVVFVDNPSIILWGKGTRIKCCWWDKGKINYVYYEEDEIVSFEF